MPDWRRLLLGLSVVVLLLPVIEVATSGGMGRVVASLAGSQPTPQLDRTALVAHEIIGRSPSAASGDVSSTHNPSSTPVGEDSATRDGKDSATSKSNSNSPPTNKGTHSSQHETTTTRPSSELSGSDPSSPPNEVSSTRLTGSACPCTVTGTITLEGPVILKGDLIVDGGKLVARSGVDLEGNGFQIMLINGAIADIQGTPTSTWSGTGSGANLKRDINFNNLKRIMFMGGAGPSVLRYFSVVNSGTPATGDYPLHWHLNGNSTRGTVVEGVVVLNGAHHAFVPHGSNGITFKDTIAKNIRDTAYWWDTPGTNCSERRDTCTIDNSNEIVFDHALVDGVRPLPGTNGHRVAGFQLGAGAGNIVRNSAAINIEGGADCSGFHWPEAANQNVGGTVWTFSNNYSRSAGCHGIFVWQNDGSHHVIMGFAGSGISHGAYGNSYEYRGVDVPYVEVHAAGWNMVGGHVGTVFAKRHQKESAPTVVFDHVAIDRFVVQNAANGGTVPGEYVLKGTGLACSDIEYESVVRGTRVVVDGQDCLVN